MYKLEVKTNFKNDNKPSNSKLFGTIVSSWIMGAKHESISDPNLFYCFVNIGKDTNTFRFFIVPSKVVAKYVREEHELWLTTDLTHQSTAWRNFRLGIAEANYRIDTPVAAEYENNWTF